MPSVGIWYMNFHFVRINDVPLISKSLQGFAGRHSFDFNFVILFLSLGARTEFMD